MASSMQTATSSSISRVGFGHSFVGASQTSFRSVSFPSSQSHLFSLSIMEERSRNPDEKRCGIVKAVSSSNSDQIELDISLVVRGEMPLEPSPRANSVKPSKTVAITDQATALVQAGIPVIRLTAGEPDFDTPAPIAQRRMGFHTHQIKYWSAMVPSRVFFKQLWLFVLQEMRL